MKYAVEMASGFTVYVQIFTSNCSGIPSILKSLPQ
jgi:hypothetical protein